MQFTCTAGQVEGVPPRSKATTRPHHGQINSLCKQYHSNYVQVSNSDLLLFLRYCLMQNLVSYNHPAKTRAYWWSLSGRCCDWLTNINRFMPIQRRIVPQTMTLLVQTKHAKYNISVFSSFFCISNNQDQCNLARSGIAVTSPSDSSFAFARWQHRTDDLAIWLGIQHLKSLLPCGVGNHI